MKFRAMLVGIGLAVSASFGLAQQRLDPDLNPTDLVRRIDADRDGFITRDEWNRYFANNDENKDGMLSRDEAAGKEGQERGGYPVDPAVDERFAKLDTDKDGTISAIEWKGTKRAFAHIDADRDGLITREEYRSPNARSWNEVFANMDVNRDRLITRSEWQDTDDAFKRLDRDRNGVLSEREFYKLW